MHTHKFHRLHTLTNHFRISKDIAKHCWTMICMSISSSQQHAFSAGLRSPYFQFISPHGFHASFHHEILLNFWINASPSVWERQRDLWVSRSRARTNRSQLCFLWKYQLLSYLCLNCTVQASPSNGQAMDEKIVSGIVSYCVCHSIDTGLPDHHEISCSHSEMYLIGF